MKNLAFEYGYGTMGAELPDDTDVIIPGISVPNPSCIPQELLEGDIQADISIVLQVSRTGVPLHLTMCRR